MHQHFKEKNSLRKPKVESKTEQNVTNIINLEGDNNVVLQDIGKVGGNLGISNIEHWILNIECKV